MNNLNNLEIDGTEPSIVDNYRKNNARKISDSHKLIARELSSGISFDDSDQTINPILLVILRSIREFSRVLEAIDLSDKNNFQYAAFCLSRFGVSDSDVAEHFGTTANAVNRWVNGKSAPSTIIRSPVIAFGLELLAERGTYVCGKYFSIENGRPIGPARPGGPSNKPQRTVEP